VIIDCYFLWVYYHITTTIIDGIFLYHYHYHQKSYINSRIFL